MYYENYSYVAKVGTQIMRFATEEEYLEYCRRTGLNTKAKLAGACPTTDHTSSEQIFIMNTAITYPRRSLKASVIVGCVKI